jgi:hypothetical protein
VSRHRINLAGFRATGVPGKQGELWALASPSFNNRARVVPRAAGEFAFLSGIASNLGLATQFAAKLVHRIKSLAGLGRRGP